MSAARNFIKRLGIHLVELLGGEYRFLSSKSELRRQNGSGNDVIILSGSMKWSPDVSISFYVGRNFDAARVLEKQMGVYSPPYHVQQYSPAAPKMAGLDYFGPHTWAVNIENPPEDLATQIHTSIEGIGNPFFKRFYSVDAARNALIHGDSWCFPADGIRWDRVFSLDVVTDNIEHFEQWIGRQDPLYQDQAAEYLEKLAQQEQR